MNATETGKCSWFGGPQDTGVGPEEGLALVSAGDLGNAHFSQLFLPEHPADTTGLARMLNPAAFYCAMRWDYQVYPRAYLRAALIKVSAASGKAVFVRPVDWGPNEDTGRLIDLSPGTLQALGITTDDNVTVTLPPRPSPQLSEHLAKLAAWHGTPVKSRKTAPAAPEGLDARESFIAAAPPAVFGTGGGETMYVQLVGNVWRQMDGVTGLSDGTATFYNGQYRDDHPPFTANYLPQASGVSTINTAATVVPPASMPSAWGNGIVVFGDKMARVAPKQTSYLRGRVYFTRASGTNTWAWSDQVVCIFTSPPASLF